MYRVIKAFTDLQNSCVYREGDVFPKNDTKIGAERIKELLSGNNRMKEPLIQEVLEKPKQTRKKKTD